MSEMLDHAKKLLAFLPPIEKSGATKIELRVALERFIREEEAR